MSSPGMLRSERWIKVFFAKSILMKIMIPYFYWWDNQRILKSNKCFFKTVFSVVYRSLSRNDHLLLSKLDQKHHHGMTI